MGAGHYQCPGFLGFHLYIDMLHSSCSKSSARPATNRRNAMRRVEANAEWGALDFEQEL